MSSFITHIKDKQLLKKWWRSTKMYLSLACLLGIGAILAIRFDFIHVFVPLLMLMFACISFINVILILISEVKQDWILFHGTQWFINHSVVESFQKTDGFQLVDNEYLEGEYEGYLIRIEYVSKKGEAFVIKLNERTGENEKIYNAGIKYTLFCKFQKLENSIQVKHKRKNRFQFTFVEGKHDTLNWNTEFSMLSLLDDRPKNFMSEAKFHKKLEVLVKEATHLALEPYFFPTDNRIDWKRFHEDMKSVLV